MLIAYVRRSRKGEKEGTSIEKQREEIAAWAERSGVELAGWIEEPGVSGHKSWRERELGTAIEMCRQGKAEGVVVAYFSRLTREKMSATWEVLEELTPFRLVAVREGIDSPPGDVPDWNQAIQGFQANTEWNVNRKWLSIGKHEVYEAGAYVNGNIPVGYNGEPLVNKKGNVTAARVLQRNEHAEQIAHAFSVRASGGSWTETARVLDGIPALSGETRWTVRATRALVMNSIYRGTLRCTCGCGKTKFIPELVIVTRDIWTKAQPKPGAQAGRKDGGQSLLAGMIRCASCGHRMSHSVSKTPGKEYHFYRCRNKDRCNRRAAIRTDVVEALVKDEALVMMSIIAADLGRGHEADVETLARLEHERDQARERLAALVRIIDPLDPGAEARLQAARAEVEAAENALLAESQAGIEQITEEQVTEAFASAPVEEQRQLLRRMIEGVTVTYDRDVEVHQKVLAWTPRAA